MHPLLRKAFDLLDERDVSGTQRVVISASVEDEISDHMRENGLSPTSILVLFDDHTRDAIGERTLHTLKHAGWDLQPYQVATRKEPPPACTDRTMKKITDDLRDRSFDQVLTVGSGTITDMGKLIAAQREMPVISVATAASMNGYTSKISAILKDGVKQTVPSVAPKLCFADPRVLADAPPRMTGSGAGDAYSRFVASADWKLSHLLHDTVYDARLAELLGEAAQTLRTVPAEIGENRTEAVTELAVVLYVTGLAQQAALPNTQASGGEHLVSHYLDMIGGHEDFDHKPDLHGRQVAVGTVYASHVYEAAAGIDLSDLPVSELCSRHLSREDLRARLDHHFRGLSAAVVPRAMANYPNADEYRERLKQYPSKMESLRSSVMEPWLDAHAIAAELQACGAPTTFSEIGVSEELALDTIRYCRHVRNRYTILHLASELGVHPGTTSQVATDML
jgi:glycerol-1-phosphate dehydrogenase [NAD(P)+]